MKAAPINRDVKLPFQCSIETIKQPFPFRQFQDNHQQVIPVNVSARK